MVVFMVGTLTMISGLGLRVQTGGRYFFTDNFGVNAELFVENNSITSGGFKAGVTYQF